MSEVVRGLISKCLGLGWFFLALGSITHIPRLVIWLQQDNLISACFISLICCQGMKPLFKTEKKDGKINWRRLWGPGGMPSSHVAVVVTLLLNVGRDCGWSSNTFQIVAVFASIVIYDAVTLRNTVGSQSRMLNSLITTKSPEDDTRVPEEVGHNPLEALAGVLIAVIVTILLN